MPTPTDRDASQFERTTLDELEGSARVRVFEGEPQTMKLALEAGERVPPHRHPDRQVVLHLLEGRLALALDDEEYELEAGDLVQFDGTQEVSPKALEASTALLVLARRVDD